MVGHAKCSDLSGLLQVIEGPGNFLRFHQRVGTVDEENVDVVRSQRLEGLLCRRHNVLIGRVIAHRISDDAGLRLEDNSFAFGGRQI